MNAGAIPWGWISAGVTAIGGLIVWFVKLSVERTLEERDRQARRIEERKDAEAKKRDTEAIERDRMILRGLKTLTESQYEVIYALKNGTHNGGIDDCLDEITAYKADVNDWILRLASDHR
jgi:hypothetical protein